MLDSDFTNLSINVVQLIESGLAEYSQGKEGYDKSMSEAVQFTYKVVDEFKSSGNKTPEIFSHNAIFVDCSHIQKDVK